MPIGRFAAHGPDAQNTIGPPCGWGIVTNGGDMFRFTPPEGWSTTGTSGGLMAEELLAQPALTDVLVSGPPRDLSPEAIRRGVMHYYHPVGTTPMGTDPARSVCDPHGRVHGIDRVVVADVSLMPQVPRANTDIPAVVVGERIAQLLIS